ncbi:MAG TPA: hypothetical protein VIJ62_11810 [Rhizomicrobium sp.]
MSELINKNDNRATIRWKLLTGASALALTAYISPIAHAEDSVQPQVWIELGGQLSRLEDGQETFSPVFPNSPSRPSMFSPSQRFERSPLYSVDDLGKISFQPENSDWIFSASVRYGRSANNRDAHQQSYPKSFVTHLTIGTYHLVYAFPAAAGKFADTTVANRQSHAIVDFQVGKDVGLGLFGGRDASSVLALGVRYAQFSSKTNIAVKSDPDWHRLYKYVNYPSFGITNVKWVNGEPYHSNVASLVAMRNFHGLGPSISWNSSMPVVGNSNDTSLMFDWGLNAALLFGRQTAKTHHQTTGRYHKSGYPPPYHRPITFQGPATPDHARVRAVTVPNVGGFAGLSFRIENFKVSAGYRADLFFGAMDGGIDAAKKENVGFYGPFASVSVGLGG